MDLASYSATSGRCRTAVTVASGAEDGYTLRLESFDDLARALSRVFTGMFAQPCG